MSGSQQDTHHYDLLVIGGGSGGVATARRAAEYGARVALIENNKLGGTCVNVGCVPKKVMWYSAHIQEALHLAPDYGFAFPDDAPKFNFAALKTARDQYIQRLNKIYDTMLANAGVDLITGLGHFLNNETVVVHDQYYSADHILIATGGKPSVPDIPGKALGITSDGFFALDQIPNNALIIGAGYIGVEIAGVLNAFGAEIDICYRSKSILRDFDHSLQNHLSQQMQRDGIRCRSQSTPTALSSQDGNIIAHWPDQSQSSYDQVIWATGRAPNIDKLDLSNTDVQLTDKGFVKVDDQQRTTAQNIFALGDIIGEAELTPVAIATGRKLAGRLFNQQTSTQDFSLIPTVVFSHPPIGTIGMTEQQAIAKYGADDIHIYTSTFKPMLYALSDDAKKVPTFMKVICHGADEKVIGLHICGRDADEILQGFGVAAKMGATKADLDACIAIHPTSAEELVTLR